MLIEILFKMLLFKGGVLIYAEHCIKKYICITFSVVLVVFDLGYVRSQIANPI